MLRGFWFLYLKQNTGKTDSNCLNVTEFGNHCKVWLFLPWTMKRLECWDLTWAMTGSTGHTRPKPQVLVSMSHNSGKPHQGPRWHQGPPPPPMMPRLSQSPRWPKVESITTRHLHYCWDKRPPVYKQLWFRARGSHQDSTVLDETWALARASNKHLYAFAFLWMSYSLSFGDSDTGHNKKN